MAVRRYRTMPPGTRVAERYVVIRYLCSGGMGDVYEVEHTLLGRRFALKRLTADKTAKAHHVERFVREARAAAATGHPGVVEVVDLGFADEGWPYLVMERLHGENLRQRLGRGPLDAAEIVQVGRVALDALDAVHRCGVVHRDIKPENLFLCDALDDDAPRVKILDFGLAELRAPHAAGLVACGAVVGTPHYMAPEQARGAEVDHRADLYGVGAVLYECAAGRPPFTASTYAELLARILDEPVAAEPLEHAPPQLRSVILRALAKRPEDRFSDAALMRRMLCGEPAARPPSVSGLRALDALAPEPVSSVSWTTQVPTLDDGDIATDATVASRLARWRWREVGLVTAGAMVGAALTALVLG
jgi:eukaryotic-like serine/threonine-protein kinase